eukprot:c18106_g2_i3.p1 GENE.c18106_g2_i3~~c18106_g2_i3.p1  ORF type:complete len:590 (+),score=127.91 c18106_g2_i3:37-1806(+)
MKEVLTLQFGNQANYVGGHFWNIQDEGHLYQFAPDYHVLFRETINPQFPIVPRVVLMDTVDGLGSMQEDGTRDARPAEEIAQEALTEGGWGNQVEVRTRNRVLPSNYLKNLYREDIEMTDQADQDHEHDQQPQQENAQETGQPMQDDDSEENRLVEIPHGEFDSNDVKYWTDYSKTQYHPKSIFTAQQVPHEEPSFLPVCRGTQIGKDLEESWFDRVRYFLEECDRPGGFHVITDTQTGFAGIGLHLLTAIRDEFPGRPCFTFSLLARPQYASQLGAEPLDETTTINPGNSMYGDAGVVAINRATVLAGLHNNEVINVPIDTSHLQPTGLSGCNLSRPFHSAAIVAALIDSATLPYRQQQATDSIASHAANLVHKRHNTVLCSSLCYPFSFGVNSGIVPALQRLGPLFNSSGMMSFVPGVDFGTFDEPVLPFSESIVCRGVMPRTVGREHFEDYLELYYCKHRKHHLVAHPIPIPVPHPQYFPLNLNDAGLKHEVVRKSTIYSQDGIIGGNDNSQPFQRSGDVFSVPAISHVQNNRGIGSFLTNAAKAVERGAVAGQVLAEFQRHEVGPDELEEMNDQLLTMADDYEDL